MHIFVYKFTTMTIFRSRETIFRKILRSQCLLFLLLSVASCTPPEDPIKCSSTNSDCIITNTYGMFPDRSVCKAANVTYPTSEQELISVVSTATMAQRKMKVATRFHHSIPKLACPDGQDGLLISTKNLDRIVGIDAEAMTMTVESGVTLRQIISEAAKAGLALPYAPYWWGLTIGGILGTGAHGSSLWGKGSCVHDHVVGLRIVTPAGPEEGFAKVRFLDVNNPQLDAARVSLGVLGVISQITLKLEPLFKRSITYETKEDSDLADEVLTFGNKHEFGDIGWYPSQRKAVYRIDDRVPSNTSGNGLYNSIPFRGNPSAGLALVRSTEETQEALKDANGKCINARLTTLALRTAAFGLTNRDLIFRGYPVIGFQNRLQSSGTCLDSPSDALITVCPWDPRIKSLFFFQTTFSIALPVVKNFILDVQRLVSLDPQSLCVLELYNGILMRYVKKSSAYLSKDQDSVDFDITYYRSKDPMTPRLYEDFIEEIEQMALFKYGALPHWGKNRNFAFLGAINHYRNAGEFLRVKDLNDPSGLFSSEWTDQVLGLRGGLEIVKEGCALEGLCICSEDVHCAPKKGYFCRPGKVYKEARVCTRVDSEGVASS